MKEEWRDIIGYEGLYQVSNFGRIKSLRRKVFPKTGAKPYWIKERIKVDHISTGGYRMISLNKQGKSHEYHVHRLVAQAFIPNPNNYPTINHKDENVINNHVDNLEWCTQAYNNSYKDRLKRQAATLKKNHKYPITKEKLIVFIKEGLTYPQIASVCHCSTRTIKQYGTLWGINKHTVLGNPDRKYEKLNINKNELSDLLNYGFTTRYIAELYGVDSHTIIKYKKKYGLFKEK